MTGDGPPLLIFNGIGASAGLLRPLMLRLNVTCITFDLPGVGASRPSLVPRRMRHLARLAAQVLDTLGIRECHVMGVSWGGGLAQQFARQYPRRTQRLILAATSTGQVMVPPRPSVILRMATPLRYLSAGHFVNIAGEIYGGDFRHDAARVKEHARHMTPPSITGYLGQLYTLTGWTSLFWLHEIKAPALVMAGTDDPIIPMANARILAQRLPNGRLNTYDCGHLFILTRLDQVARDIDAFLDTRTV
ncbi:MAG: poly(3-hydroxyalkanoate) depolymerase [Kiritimatiellia bacterium]|nr:poly(3-hydroxyalkanoate) depolymerase [Kiritimatiellia bacterium]